MLKIIKLIIIITFLLTIQIIKSANSDRIDNLSKTDFNVVARALTDDLFLIFHKEKTATIEYLQNNLKTITNTPFKYLGTSYPLVYKYYNSQLIYYIVSITKNSANNFIFMVYESNNTSNDPNLTPFNIEFSQLNSLSSINENEFIASIINKDGDCDVIKCTLENIYTCSSLNSGFLSLCRNNNKILNVYYQPDIDEYIYLLYSPSEMTSGIFYSSGDDIYKQSQKTVTLNGDCNSITQLQTIYITDNIFLNCFMTENQKVCCSKGEYDKEKGEYNLNEFTADLSCQSNSFSIDKLDNDYILISCPGQQSNENPKYILYDKNKKIRGSGVITWSNGHYMRDFSITPNGDIYIIAYHPVNCGIFHHHKITKENYMCSDFNYVIKPQDEHLTQLNSITDNGINIPSTIKINQSNCDDVVRTSSDRSISSQMQFINIYVKEKYNINCTLTYSSGLNSNFQLLCDLNFTSCDSHCEVCELSSVSSSLMNCNFCTEENKFVENPEENIDSGNCCEEVSNCQTYNFNCTCKDCITGYIEVNGVCTIPLENVTQKLNIEDTI